MKITSPKFLVIVILVIWLLAYPGVYVEANKQLYRQAVKAAGAGEPDAAFMNFRLFSEEFKNSKLAENTIFAMGEYYFLTSDYYDALAVFSRFIQRYPKSKARIFALAYLLEIAKKERDIELAENLAKAIISSRQVVLLFSESKETRYLSPFLKNYKAVYSIDRLEFYIDGSIFTQVSY